MHSQSICIFSDDFVSTKEEVIYIKFDPMIIECETQKSQLTVASLNFDSVYNLCEEYLIFDASLVCSNKAMINIKPTKNVIIVIK